MLYNILSISDVSAFRFHFISSNNFRHFLSSSMWTECKIEQESFVCTIKLTVYKSTIKLKGSYLQGSNIISKKPPKKNLTTYIFTVQIYSSKKCTVQICIALNQARLDQRQSNLASISFFILLGIQTALTCRIMDKTASLLPDKVMPTQRNHFNSTRYRAVLANTTDKYTYICTSNQVIIYYSSNS